MEVAALCLTLVAIVLWAGISTRAAVISTPIFFVAVGLVLAEGLHFSMLKLTRIRSRSLPR